MTRRRSSQRSVLILIGVPSSRQSIGSKARTDVREIEGGDSQNLLAAEGEQLPRQVCGSVALPALICRRSAAMGLSWPIWSMMSRYSPKSPSASC